MIKYFWRLATEPLRKGDPSRPLRWRMGMRLNHIHNHLRMKHPKVWVVIIATARTLLCRPFGHRWNNFEHVKYGDFGVSRSCKVCRLCHRSQDGADTYHDTHRPGGWVKVDKP
ncbi:hypothetical protein M2401_000868 [Pseudomonas sp. JUb42]|uniref:hypothetical protein n=1 Tax=Pseudomonas sp. JUb42 TaxID=2940611 RepID=UPI0021688F0C|nr:hypothetical protein [Pseudomonas sp. JUb42]MCS3467147.1 hypothetical protein [Pseudomonas sp. JUb42]